MRDPVWFREMEREYNDNAARLEEARENRRINESRFVVKSAGMPDAQATGEELRWVNCDDDAVIEFVASAKVGESRQFGGGAFAESLLERIA